MSESKKNICQMVFRDIVNKFEQKFRKKINTRNFDLFKLIRFEKKQDREQFENKTSKKYISEKNYFICHFIDTKIFNISIGRRCSAKEKKIRNSSVQNCFQNYRQNECITIGFYILKM